MEERLVATLVGRVDRERVHAVRERGRVEIARKQEEIAAGHRAVLLGAEARRILVGAFCVDVEEVAVRRQRRTEVGGGAPRDRRGAVQPGDAPAHERRRDRQAAEAARNPYRRRVEGVDRNLDPPAETERRLHQPGLVADERVANRRPRVVGVRRQVSLLQRVDRLRSVDLRQVHVTERRLHISDHRVLCDDLLALAHDRDDVEVLEDALVPLVLAGVDVERRRAEVVRDSADDRVDRRSVRRGDVDSLMEREEAGPVEATCEHAVLVDGPRVAEVPADRMLLVERSKRPAV